MSVKDPNKAYLNMVDRWQRCRDASAGKDAIYNAGEKYLPKLTDMSQPEYDAYRGRAPFFNATWRTISGLQGMMFRQPPQVEVDQSILPYLDDITMSAVPMQIFTLELVEEVLTVGRVGVMVDYPQVDISSLTLADAQAQNLRPMMKSYLAESILNWKMSPVNNKTVLSQVVLQETVEIYKDEFTFNDSTQYRVLDLFPLKLSDNSIRTIYRVRVFTVEPNGAGILEDVLQSTTFPIINGDYIDYIPFYFLGTDDVSCNLDVPPLIDLIDMNISHYQCTADYEHGCHFTGLPTPVISGYTPTATDDKFGIGSMTAWVFPRADAKASYLEFTGQGLGCLERNLAAKEQKMAVLGARMLEAQSAGVESADTAGIHRSGEQSTLASIAQAFSLGFTNALKTFSSFAGIEDTSKVTFDLNRDFFPPIIDALTLTALVAGWQNGAYSYQSLFNMLKQNEIIALEQTVQGEIAAMKIHPPLIPGGTQVNQNAQQQHPTQQTLDPANPTIRQLQTPPKSD